MKSIVLGLGSTMAIMATLASSSSPLAATPPRAPLSREVSVNVVFWDQARGFESVRTNANLIREVNPFWYTLNTSADVIPYRRASGESYTEPSTVSELQALGIKVVPTIANTYSNDVWPRRLVADIIHSDARRHKHIANIVELVLKNNYDGINLDYENLESRDRKAFTTFVQELAGALHKHGKILNVVVYAKTTEPGTWDGPQAQDYHAIGAAADRVVIMLYNYHWGGSKAGPITPPDWEEAVLSFARKQIPASKISHGIPLFGYDWIGKKGQDTTWEQNIATSKNYRATIHWSSDNQAPWFKYHRGGREHEVWYENAASFEYHLQRSLRGPGAGINLWRVGGEDPAIWGVIRRQLVKPMQNSTN